MRGNHILIIESDAFLAGIYASKFSQEHVRTEVAETLADAKKKIAKKIPRAIILDIAMENSGGFEFIKYVREQTATFAVPIVVLTNLGDQKEIARAFSAGANEYLIKGHFIPIEAVRKVKKLYLV
jgi:DNA-binding response OmpR family regulator